MTNALIVKANSPPAGLDGRPPFAMLPKDGILKTRERLLRVLTSLAETATLQDAHASQSAVALLREKVEQNRFYLTVVGQFKRGKTTFLNALLGAEVLPVAILPLTSVVTMLRYSESPSAEVVFQSGLRSTIRLAELGDYVTEKGNPKNVKRVSHVIVAYPSEYLRGGVALVDTPGIGSVYTHNTQVTYDFLPQVDAAIFVTSPEPPITNAEIEFLTDLASHVRKVFVVLNKTDLLSASQLREVLDFTRHSLPESIAATSDSVIAISAAQALKAKDQGDPELLAACGFQRLEEKLGKFLASEKNLVFYASVARNTHKLIADLRLSCELQIRAAQMPLDELRTKLAELDRHLAHAQQEREDSQVLLQNSVSQISKLFEAEAMSFAGEMVESLSTEIRRHWQHHESLGRKELASEMDRLLKLRVEQLFDGWRAKFEGDATGHFRQATNRFAQRVNELIAGVRHTAGSLFGFSVQEFDAVEELAELEPCGYFTDPVLDWGLGNAPLLLPRSIFRRYLLRVMVRKAETELERNATRVAFDYKKRLSKSVSLFLEGMTAKLNETVDGIRGALTSVVERQQAGAAAAQVQLEERQAILARLDECKRDLDSAADPGVAI
jgi:GTPase SAR1 family protein